MSIEDGLIRYSDEVRLAIFLTLMTVLACLEAIYPRRQYTIGRWVRWLPHALLMLLNTLLLKLLMPVMAVGFSLMAAQQGWGLLHHISLPLWFECGLAVVFLDCAIYWQHRLFHSVPFLWRLHRVHHTDKALDASSALRFHPIEIVLSMLFKMGVIFVLGPSALAVILFEVLLSSMALFTHANLFLSVRLDSVLRPIIVTPDMHRIHHSNLRREIDSNYGFALSCWDRFFRSYRAQPEAGQLGMVIGLKGVELSRATRFSNLLIEPLRKDRAV